MTFHGIADFLKKLILEKGKGIERGGEREIEIGMLFYLLMHSLLDSSCTCPDQRLNPQLWRIGMTA